MAGAFEELRAELTLDADQMESGVSKAKSSLSGLETALVGVGAAGAAAGAAGIGKAVSSFASFDKKLTESTAIMDDVSKSMKEKLGKTARETAAQLGMSSDKAAESYYFLASAGLDATESMEAMPKVAEFAAAGQMEMADATDYATDVMKAFQIPTENMTRVTDSMTAAVTRHNQTMEGMGTAMSYVAPVAKGLGMSVEETSAAIGMLGDAGIKGSKAGTTLRQALNKLSNPTLKMQDKLSELGVNVKDSSGEMRDFSAILGDLKSAGADTADIMELFGARAGPGMQVLLEEGGKAIDKEAEKIKEMGGITKDVAEKQLDTLNKQFDRLTTKLQNAGIAIGGYFAPALTKLLKMTNSAMDRFNKLNESTDGLVGAMSLVGTTVGGVALALGTLAGGPIAGVVAGLAAASTAAAAMSGEFDGVGGAVQGAVSVLRQQFLSTLQTLRATVLPILSDVTGAWASMDGRVESVASGLAETIGARLTGAIERMGARTRSWLTKIQSWWEQHGAAVTSTVNQFSTHIQEAFIQLMAGISTAVQGEGEGEGSFTFFFKEALGEMLAAARSLGITLPESIRSALSKVSTAVSTKLDGILAWWDAHKRQIQTKARTAYAKAKSAVSSSIGKVRETVSGALSRAEAAWNTHAPRVRQQASAAYQTARSKISSALSTLNSAVVQPALSRAKGEWDKHKEDIKRVAGGAIDWLKQHWDSVLATLLGTVLAPGLGSMYQAVKDNFGLIKTTVRTYLSEAKATVSTLMGAVKTQIVTPLTTAGTETNRVFGEIVAEVRQSLGLVRDVVSRVTAVVLKAWNRYVSEMSETFRTHLSGSNGIVANARDAFNTLWDNIIKPTLDTIQAAWDKWGDEILGVVRGTLNTVSSVLEIGMDAILTTINVVLDLISGDWEGAWDSIAGFVERTLGEIGSWLESTGAAILTTAIDTLIAAIKTPFEKLYDFLIGGSLIPDLISDITAAFENWDIVGTITDILSSVFDAFVSLATDVIGDAGEIPTLISDITTAFTDWSIVETVTGILSSVFDEFSSLVTDIVGEGGEIPTLISDVTSAFTDWDIAEDAAGVLSDVVDEFSSFATDIIGGEGIIKTMIGNITSYLTGENGAKGALKSAATTAFDSMAGAAKSAFNSALPDKIPSITIGGNTPDPLPDAPEVTIGGQSLDALELATGGFIEDDGLAMLHSGEYVLNEQQVNRTASPTTTAPATADPADIDEAALGEAIADNMDIDQEIILDAVFDRGATTDAILDEINDRRTRQSGSST